MINDICIECEKIQTKCILHCTKDDWYDLKDEEKKDSGKAKIK